MTKKGNWEERLIKNEEKFKLIENKKKKPYSSKTYTTGDPDLNIAHFNKALNGGKDVKTDGYLNGTFKNSAAEKACAEVGTFASQSPDGGSSVSLGGGEGGGMGESFKITEDVSSSMPVTPLPEQTIIDFVMSHLTTNPTNPKTFPLGYIKEFSNEIAAKFRGGRGSAGEPIIRIFKCTEYSALYAGIAWTKTDKTLAADSVLGTNRHTGERTGFNYNSADAVADVIGSYQDGSKALQVYIDDSSVQKVSFYVSINDADLALIDKDDLLPYLTPAAAAKLLAPVIRVAGRDSAGDSVYDRPINRLKLSNIYMIGNNGPKLM